MGNDQKIISFQEFSSHPSEVFESVLDGVEIIIKRGEDEAITLMPDALPNDELTIQEKIKSILAAAGTWSDVDTDELLSQLRASRNIKEKTT